MTTTSATRLGVECFLCGPKMLVTQVVAQKGCIVRWDAIIGRIGVVSHHL